MKAHELCLFSLFLFCPLFAQKPLPAISDGKVLTGPGEFRHDGELRVHGSLTLRDMTLHLNGPVHVNRRDYGDSITYTCSFDPGGAPNGMPAG